MKPVFGLSRGANSLNWDTGNLFKQIMKNTKVYF